MLDVTTLLQGIDLLSGVKGEAKDEQQTADIVAELRGLRQSLAALTAAPLVRKGEPVMVCAGQQLNALIDKPIDCGRANFLHIRVEVTGSGTSAVISVEGAKEAGANYRALPATAASQTVTTSTAFDVPVGERWAKIRIASIAGTFTGNQGYTIEVTPFVGSPAFVGLLAGSSLIGKVGFDQTTPGTTNGVQLAEGAVDDGGVTLGTQRVVPVGFLADEAAPDSVDEGDVGIPRMTLNRILWAALRAKNAASADTELKGDDVGNLRVRISTSADGAHIDGRTDADGVPAGTVRLEVQGANYGLNPSTTWDRLRTLAASGAGLGVQQVGTLGELITLAASAARTESANGTAVTGLGWRNRYIILFDLTVADTDAGDTLDVYVDVSLDGNTWLNAVHFTQIIGTNAASKRYAVLDPAAPGTSEILVTADAAAGAVRPSMFGPQMRARWAITDAGTDDASFTFAITAYAI